MNTVVWIMMFVNFHTNGLTTGAEFTTKARCEQAAVIMKKTADDSRWGLDVRQPLCVRIEK